MINSFVLNVKRAETPLYARLKNLAQGALRLSIRVPRPLARPMRLLYYAHFRVVEACRYTIAALYRNPLFQSRCDSVGRRLRLEQLPYIAGPVHVYVGDDVYISGELDIRSGHVFDRPEVRIGNRVFLAHGVRLYVNREIVIEDGAGIGPHCVISDGDGHAADYEKRIRGLPSAPDEIKPVHIGRYAWIGERCVILKGVTIGEGAIVGFGSVVMTDVPPHSVAMGNPARIVKRQ